MDIARIGIFTGLLFLVITSWRRAGKRTALEKAQEAAWCIGILLALDAFIPVHYFGSDGRIGYFTAIENLAGFSHPTKWIRSTEMVLAIMLLGAAVYSSVKNRNIKRDPEPASPRKDVS